MNARTIPNDVRVFARFATVGVASNALIYILYLVLSVGLAMEPVTAATAGWIAAVVISFLLNRSWTFEDSGPRTPTFIRYALLYASAYVLNILLLVLLVERMGLAHAVVQGVLIVSFGLLLYLGQRFWIFSARDRA